MADETPRSVLDQLNDLTSQLHYAVIELRKLDREAIIARAVYEETFATLFIDGSGSVDARKQFARVTAKEEWREAELAESDVRTQRKMIDALMVRIDVARTAAATVRSEMSTIGYQP